MTTRGERLSAYLIKRTGGRHGWQADLVARSGLKRQTITKWTRPEYDSYPDMDTLAALAGALGVRPWELVAAMDGDEAWAPSDPELKEQMRDALEELLAERDARQPPRTPR